MGDAIERNLEETVPILRAAQRCKLLTPSETRDVVRRRRDHEYAVASAHATRAEYLKYAAFERALAAQLAKRAARRNLKKQKTQLVLGKSAARVNLVYSRAVRRLKGDDKLWLHYARHCVETGAVKAAGRVFAKALAFRGDSEDVWLAAVAFHFDTCQDVTGGRALAQRALRALPQSTRVWREYFRLEVCYLAKLAARRLAMGLSVLGKGEGEGVGKDEGGKGSGGLEISKDGPREAMLLSANESRREDECDANMTADGEVVESGAAASDGKSPGGNNGDSSGKEGGACARGDLNSRANNARHAKPNGEASEIKSLLHVENPDAAGNHAASSVPRLTFWDGGVPLTVFINACKKAKLCPKDRVDFFDIAASTPFVPTKLLTSLSDTLRFEYPNCISSRLVDIRAPWDAAHSEFRLKMVRESEGAEGDHSALAQPSDELKKRRQILTKEALNVYPAMEKALVECSATLDESAKAAVLACVESFKSAVVDVDTSGRSKAAARILSEKVQTGRLTEEIEERDGKGSDAKSFSHAPEIPSIRELYRLIVDEKHTLSAAFYESLKSQILIPFRGIDEEMIVCSWLSRESDVQRLREISDKLLSLPPVTMQSVRACIAAELRLWGRKKKNVETADAERSEMVSAVRKLFKQAVSLTAAKRDVDLWLEYVDFERRTAEDAKQANMAGWKATKVLDRSNVELFTERQTLRNLAR